MASLDAAVDYCTIFSSHVCMVCNFLSLSYYILLWKVLMKSSVGYCTIFSYYVIFLIYNIMSMSAMSVLPAQSVL